MLSLNDREWKEFFIDEIFSVGSGKRLETRNKVPGTTAFIGATDNTNGITGFIGNTNNSKDKNVLGVNYNGAPCIAFYHPYECIFSDDVKRLHLKEFEDNKYIFEFFATIIRKQKQKYNYGYKCNEKRMVRQKIIVPVTDEGNPDVDFMEAYIKQQEQDKVNAYIQYCKERLAELGTEVEIETASDKHWESFFIKDIFDKVERGKRLKKDDHIKGDKPYVSSTALNNGVDQFIGNEKGTRVFEDCLSLANSGSVGSCFYEPFPFVASDHVTHLKKDDASKFIYLFMATMLNRLSEKYNFNREINDFRINREKIILPVTEDGKPDYDYMEQYAKNMMIRKYQSYLDYLQKQ